MKNIIWTEKELKAIKSIIITRSNHKLTEDLEFVKLNNCNAYTNTGRSLYEEVIEETQKLFFTTNEKEITRKIIVDALAPTVTYKAEVGKINENG